MTDLRKAADERTQHLIPDQVIRDVLQGVSPCTAWARYRGHSSPWEYAAATGAEGAEVDTVALRWQKLENHRSPPLSFLREVSDVLQVPMEWLLRDFFIRVFGAAFLWRDDDAPDA
jgi:hypothetical protein